ncbi:DNA polymerase III subunit gamma/tau [Cocleimonas sp. KMM 6892]|uniref:DNA polymerase III subunit gamma/tau n=1 Tax=unclassified Cocleimonas TaxID=2639732 RepID=UPI002DBA94DE|nr:MULTISPECIES: DNA polymerase III subunit gamma/tau [unclassified Cocleimonas]MEB8432264.1 DNA polymerase III subunit gamma/tau [Cocleimonas sp. KMM 6892]MEC4714650.1 DNA polymerase III subunit gamma/tau [Cocleimonas sp. KMM 6895]MEC4744536.1 DNA polymerase III subunit gamma/tau [Cocleimonas sp. KMM 6896]
MSYQVLARKWRPQNFTEMVGQEHVLRALINALDSDRLHHAYLFTGTRGVGKTTIARILAKCLNCETGVTSKPCGKCNSCLEIAAGSFLDLIEVDAASRTKVEDTRELLENVQYAPTRARFKVYLIDEVHMLTGHSFNALLKTLEEPPPHVKFLFATTDPQKLPATVLSRCLQFNLKRMPLEKITSHLSYLLEQETIAFEEPSLKLLGKAADGSMRDALSLLDQAIAYSGETVTEKAVSDMLGTVSHEPLVSILETVATGDGATLLGQVDELASISPDFDASCDALISVLHQVAVQQVVPDAINDEDSIKNLAQQLSKEDVQLFYQIALQGRSDLSLSPDPKSGFEMILLRMLSFRPLRVGMQLETSEAEAAGSATVTDSDSSKKKTVANDEYVSKGNDEEVVTQHSAWNKQFASSAEPQITPSAEPEPQSVTNNDVGTAQSHSAPSAAPEIPTPPMDEAPPWDITPDYDNLSAKPPSQSKPEETPHVTDTHSEKPSSTEKSAFLEAVTNTSTALEPEAVIAEPEKDQSIASETETQAKPLEKPDPEQIKNRLKLAWHEVVPNLGLSGRAAELIKHCLLAHQEDGIIGLTLDKGSEGLLAESIELEIKNALCDYYGADYRLDLKVQETEAVDNSGAINKDNETPAQRAQRKVEETQQQAEVNIQSDPFVIELQNRFNAQIVPGSIEPKSQ